MATAGGSSAEASDTSASGARWWDSMTGLSPRAGRAFDLVVVAGLAVVGFLLRRDALPVDGLWYDDAWVATGAIHGRLTQLMTVGSATPGFTLLLMGWHAVGGQSLRSLAVPALVAGVAGAPLLYLGLRSLRYERSICALLAAALVVADVHIVYSGRVKSYTLDPLLVLLLAVAIPRLARLSWRWPMAVAWVLSTFVLASFSGFALVATLAAGVILVLHPSSDRRVRLGAVAVQAVGLGAYYVALLRSSDLAGIQRFIGTAYDGHLTMRWNPIDLVRETMTHLGRIADVYPGGAPASLGLIALCALGGLVVASVKGPPIESLPARFLLLLVVGAFIGALLGRFPFGPSTQNLLSKSGSSGGRDTLWLLPAFAVGLAAVLHRLRHLASSRASLRGAFDAAVLVIALVVIVRGYGEPLPYPMPGSASSTAYAESHLRPGDVLLLTQAYSFAAATHLPVRLRATPDQQIGFVPTFGDARVHPVGPWSGTAVTPAELRSMVEGAHRVVVVSGLYEGQYGINVGKVLGAAGFHAKFVLFRSQVVSIWTR